MDSFAPELDGMVVAVGGVKVVHYPPDPMRVKATGRGRDTADAIVLHIAGRAQWFGKSIVVLYQGAYYVPAWALRK